MTYEKVIIGQGFHNNEFGKTATYLGRLNHQESGPAIWIDRRDIVLGIGKNEKNGPFIIGEIKKKGDSWVWVWGIPLTEIYGYEEFIREITKTPIEKKVVPK